MDTDKDRMITAYQEPCNAYRFRSGSKKSYGRVIWKKYRCIQWLGWVNAYFSKEHRFHGGHGIVGGQIPLGAGMAFGDKYHGRDAVTHCFMGDGAVRQGSFHETLNLAMLWSFTRCICC